MNYLFVFYLFVCSVGFSIQPKVNYIQQPDTSLVNFQESYILFNEKQDSLISWFFQPKSKIKPLNKTIVLSYGDFGNMSYFINQATILTQQGYNVITYDYQGFGKSTSPMILDNNFLYYEEFIDNLNTVIDFYTEEFNVHQFILMGYSMGSYISYRVAMSNKISKFSITHLICEGLMTNPMKIQAELKTIDKKVSLPLNCKEVDFSLLKPVKKMIFLGENDTIINAQFKLKFLKRNKCKIVKYKGGHLKGIQSLTEKYYGDFYFTHIHNFISEK